MKPNVLSAAETLQLKLEKLEAPREPKIISRLKTERTLEVRRLLDEVKELLALAETESARTREEAAKAGYEDGLRQATEALALAKAEYNALLERGEADMVSLALELARRIVGHHLEVDPELLAKMVTRSLSLAQSHRHIEVLIHPDDFHRLRHEELEQEVNFNFELLEDDRVPHGGCWIHTEKGTIEADLDTQIEVLAQTMGVQLWAKRSGR